MNEQELLAELLQLIPSERAEAVERVASGNPQLRARLRQLLNLQVAPSGLLAPATDGTARDSDTGPYAPGPMPDGTLDRGSVIAGRYKLLDVLGEGGMGTVYVAEQHEPVKRRVAVKLIRGGGDTKAILARFEQERQALALMDHANIARMFDGGLTEQRQPYFVMELVRGLPITAFCDQEKLDLRQRLKLFLDVCHAVQHAHQKGIIHRDLKPSNILVTLIDGAPEVKVIDFGVAKAVHQKLTDQTLITEVGRIIGTLEYMAPEQANLTNLDIDTRADVYALGVVLYELLTGKVPISSQQLRQAAYDEMLRIIRELEPPPPSHTLTRSADLIRVAANRRAEPRRLASLVSGELDWIVMRCLEKERNRRYQAASDLARDVERHLANELVEARPPSRAYRLRKILVRHKGRTLAVGLLLLTLLLGLAGTTWGLVLADSKRREAERRLSQLEKSVDLFAEMLKDVNPHQEETGGPPLPQQLRSHAERMAEQLDGEAIGDLTVVARLRSVLGRTLLGLGNMHKAIELLEIARSTEDATLRADHPNRLDTMDRLAMAYRLAGRPKDAISLLEEVARLRVSSKGDEDLDTLATFDGLASAYLDVGRVSESITLFESIRTSYLNKYGEDHPYAVTTQNNLALAYMASGRNEEAIALLKHAHTLCSATYGPEHFKTLTGMHNLACCYLTVGRHNEAIIAHEKVRDIKARRYGEDHPTLLYTLNSLAQAYKSIDRLPEAIALLERVRDSSIKQKGMDHPHTITTLHNLALAYMRAERSAEAVPLLEKVMANRVATLGADSPDTLQTMQDLAEAHLDTNKCREAIDLLDLVKAQREIRLGSEHKQTLITLRSLGKAYRKSGRMREATALFEQVMSKQTTNFGEYDLDTLVTMHELAYTYRSTARAIESIRLFEEVKARRSSRLGEDHPQTLRTGRELAAAYRDAGKLDEAIALLKDIRDKQVKNWGADHSSTLRTTNELALALKEVGQVSQSIVLLEQLRDTLGKTMASDDARYLTVLSNLALAYQAGRRVQQAIVLFEQVKSARELTLGLDHLETIAAQNNLGQAYYAAGKHQQALEQLEQVKPIRIERLGFDHPQTLNTMVNLAGVYHKVGRLQDAIHLYEQVREAQMKRLGADHNRTISTLNNLASAYHAAAQPLAAIALYEEAAAGVEKRGFNHEHAPNIVRNLIAVYENRGSYDTAEMWRRKWLAVVRSRDGQESSNYAGQLFALGLNLVRQGKYSDAELFLRESQTIRDKKEPELWTTFQGRSLLGKALLGQKKYSDAEPLLLSGYNGLNKHSSKIPTNVRIGRLVEALEPIVSLYESLGRPEDATLWRHQYDQARWPLFKGLYDFEIRWAMPWALMRL